MENTILVVAVKRHCGNSLTRVTRRVFETTAEAYEFIKALDKEMYSRVRVYEEKEVIDF